MQRSRLLILVGLLLLLGTGAVFLVLTALGSATATPTPPPPTPIPENVAQIVIAVQPLVRGVKVQQGAVALAPWPANNLPPSTITDTKVGEGKIPRFNIDRGIPILSSMIVEPGKLDFAGSEAALKIEQGKVGISIPMNRLSSVAYAVSDGDHVNILVALLFVDLNEASQTILPSKVKALLQDPATKSITAADLGNEGKVTNDGFGFPTLIQASEAQRPRLVVQQVVQDAVVLKVGTFSKDDQVIAQPTATPVPGPTPTGAPPPTPVPPPDIITLSVSQQDALVLNYFMFSGAKFTMALRAAGDASKVDTESVTLQYTMQRFRISVPTQLAYGLEPALRKLRAPTMPNDSAPVFIPLPDGTFICSGGNCP
jgi:Flp pilus assembly protein CpaB